MTARFLAIVLTLSLALAGCSGNGEIVIFATFDDVGDLVELASVRAGDVSVGTVTAITLTDDERALVEMTIDADVVLPADTAAWLSKTSLLGERFIDLRPQGDSGVLADGTTITDTRIITDFEDLVGTGSDVLALVAADRLEAAVRAGAEAVGGRGTLIGQVIDDVNALLSRYADGTDTITRLIDELAALTGTLAPDAAANAADLALLDEVAQALDDQDEQLLQSLADLQRLSTVGERILEEHELDMDDTIRRLRILLEEVNRFEGKLDEVLYYLPRHNVNTIDGAINELTQIWADFITCDVNEEDGSPAADCTPDPAGVENPPPAIDPCPLDVVRCPEEDEAWR